MGIQPEISYPVFPAVGAKRHEQGSKEARDQQRGVGVGGPWVWPGGGLLQQP